MKKLYQKKTNNSTQINSVTSLVKLLVTTITQ